MLYSQIRIGLSMAGITMIAGCSDLTVPTGKVSQGAGAAVETREDGKAQAIEMAEYLARSLRRQQVRSAVLRDLRASPYVEHRIRMNRYLQSALGQEVKTEIVASAGLSQNGVEALIEGMGAWDLFVLRQDRRRSWRGGRGALVGVGWEGIDQVVAFDLGGKRRDFDPRIGWPEETVLLLMPSEPLIPRVNPQADIPGGVIQDPDDGTLGYGIASQRPSGHLEIVAPEYGIERFKGQRARQVQCTPEDPSCGGGGSGGGSVYGFGNETKGVARFTLMEYFRVCDNPPLCDQLEIRITVDWPFFENGQMGDQHIAFISVPSNNGYVPYEQALNVVIHPRRIPSVTGSKLKLLEVLELDAPGFPTFNPHDIWCPTPKNIPYFSDHAIALDMRSSPPCLDPPDPSSPASEPNVIFNGSWTQQYP